MDLTILKQLGTLKRYLAGEVVFLAGEYAQSMYIIIKGKVEICRGIFDNASANTTIFEAGHFFGEMSLLNEAPRTVSVRSLEEGTLIMEITRQNFILLLLKQDEMSFRILTTLGERVKSVFSKLASDSKIIKAHEQDEYYSLIGQCESDQVKQIVGENTSKMVEIVEYFGKLILEIQQEGVLVDVESYGEETVFIDVIPKEHRIYELPIDESYTDFIIEKQVKCPICGGEVTSLNLKQSNLRLINIEPDMRYTYAPIDPLWFSITTCPHCLYSNFSNQFGTVPAKFINPTKEVLSRVSGLKEILNVERVNINIIFYKYYLTILCTTNPYLKDFKLAKIWLNLSWLYSDVKDDTLYKHAYDMAHMYYDKVYNSSSLELKPAEEEKLYMILAYLKLSRGDYREAQQLYFDVIRIKSGNKMIENIARDQMEDLRALVKKAE